MTMSPCERWQIWVSTTMKMCERTPFYIYKSTIALILYKWSWWHIVWALNSCFTKPRIISLSPPICSKSTLLPIADQINNLLLLCSLSHSQKTESKNLAFTIKFVICAHGTDIKMTSQTLEPFSPLEQLNVDQLPWSWAKKGPDSSLKGRKWSIDCLAPAAGSGVAN